MEEGLSVTTFVRFALPEGICQEIDIARSRSENRLIIMGCVHAPGVARISNVCGIASRVEKLCSLPKRSTDFAANKVIN